MKTLAEKPGADTDSRSAGLNRGRLHGGILIAMTLLTVAIVPSIIGRRTAGFAQRVDVPIVGDCLADFAWPTDDKPTIQGDVATQPGRSYLATSGGRVDCAQTGAGQVLSVAYDRPVATLDDQIALSSDSLCGSSLGAPGAVLGLPDWSYLDSRVEIAYYPAVFLRTRRVVLYCTLNSNGANVVLVYGPWRVAKEWSLASCSSARHADQAQYQSS